MKTKIEKKEKIVRPLTLREQFLRKERNKKILIILIQAAIVVAFFGFWELFSATGVIDSFIFSSPSRIFSTLFSHTAAYWFRHIGITLLECCCGFLIATVIGIAIAVLLWWFSTLNRVLEPFIVVLNSLPKVALGPIIIVWIGAGYQSIILMTVLICIIVTIMNAYQGFATVDKNKILLLKSMGATKLQILLKLVLPHSIPTFISILKVNVGLAWVGVILGEYLVSSAGLGHLITNGSDIFNFDSVMTSILLLCILATIMYVGVTLLEKRITRFR